MKLIIFLLCCLVVLFFVVFVCVLVYVVLVFFVIVLVSVLFCSWVEIGLMVKLFVGKVILFKLEVLVSCILFGNFDNF